MADQCSGPATTLARIDAQECAPMENRCIFKFKKKEALCPYLSYDVKEGGVNILTISYHQIVWVVFLHANRPDLCDDCIALHLNAVLVSYSLSKLMNNIPSDT
eukprot:1159284-Pelagomonas_calceolata.AAC.10